MAIPQTYRAVRFHEYGDAGVLNVEELPLTAPGPGEVLVEVRAAGINPGEIAIRSGATKDLFPATFPSGQGSDLAGVVLAVGDGVEDPQVGEEVLGWSGARSSQASHVVVPAGQLIPKPAALGWEEAGALYVAGVTAYAAVRAVTPIAGDTVAVSAAAGGVGSLVVQMLRARGVRVLGIASQANREWLEGLGVVLVEYGDGLAGRLREAAGADGIDAFIDLFGPEYVELAVELGIPRHRIETVISFEAAARLGVKAEGSAGATSQEVLADVADRVATRDLNLLVAATYPLEKVADAFRDLERRHTRGKIVLIP
ncbi:NADPH:quinone reductase-like Zn-dependent oxidoreductase [Kineosporia succinea]|uniref:NADPH:quinone reductase-like Zn-dependent oxidoreductase n=1 Tax=Kineosporia succinea TaxID=84632 RepID=A0ABT9NXL3_9ACTN|nr:NADP-dependent oxidoreductase [Kineosporia succinea]MDP9824894.1 NADPH:quinone reductase-like Zn-dependent oxidoreductase [Kineosporia succinea]